ncbi:hypothetical protein BASA81_013746 [Batrachochytrium salamandrivorans]|nr:hypothetical protein BASA81_013746 [Batrachochytrium salamandrivorans]
MPLKRLLALVLLIWLVLAAILLAVLLRSNGFDQPLAAELLNFKAKTFLGSSFTRFAYELYADNSHSVKPDPVPDLALQLRQEFGELEMCNLPRTWYRCINDPSCIQNGTCVHIEGKPKVQFNKMHLAPIKFFTQAHKRRHQLELVLARMRQSQGENPSKRIALMTLNSGFSFLFGNWFCSLQAQKLDLDRVRRETMVLARDEDARRFVMGLGFFAPELGELDSLQEWLGRATPIKLNAAPGFGQGHHSAINLFIKFGMPLDLLSLGYTVFVQDVDFVWHQYPYDNMQQQCDREHCNGIFIAEGRKFHQANGYSPYMSNHGKDLMLRTAIGNTSSLKLHRGGPLTSIDEVNTGLFMFPPHPQSIHFFQVLLQGIFLQQWKRRDQMYFNTVMFHQHFAHMNWSILPSTEFVPGSSLHTKVLASKPLDLAKVKVLHVGAPSPFNCVGTFPRAGRV